MSVSEAAQTPGASPAPDAQSRLASGSAKNVSFHQGDSNNNEGYDDDAKLPLEAGEDEDWRPKQQNPFKMPPDNDIFVLRDKEREKRRKDKNKLNKMSLWDKTRTMQGSNSRRVALMSLEDEAPGSGEEDAGANVQVKEDPAFTLAVTRHRQVEKESLTDYINKKREMFLVQYALDVKRDEIQKLERIAQQEEEKLALAEQYLEDDAAMFDEFLKENDKNSVEAVRVAEQETKTKLEKVAEIKRINAQMMTVRSEISKFEDQLKEYQDYKVFLDSLAPQEWQATQAVKREAKIAERKRQRLQQLKDAEEIRRTLELTAKESNTSREKSITEKSSRNSRFASKQSSLSRTTMDSQEARETSSHEIAKLPATAEDDDDDLLADEEELDLYFQDPNELLTLFGELEEQNLSLIQNSQETEEALEDMKRNIKNTKNSMEKETAGLRDQINRLEFSIKTESEKAKHLEMQTQMFSFGDADEDAQEKILGELNHKVLDVYSNCIGENDANISTLQMLANLENKMEMLFQEIEMLPPDRVEMAEKVKERERRQQLKEEKGKQQKLHEEERRKKAQERAREPPKKRFGKKLMYRSNPPIHKRRQDESQDLAKLKEEEELAYFFAIP